IAAIAGRLAAEDFRFSPPRAVLNAVKSANQSVFQEFRGEGGTTLSLFLHSPENGAFIVNVGDSRVYSYASTSRLVQLTRDDTIAAEVGQLNAISKSALSELEFGEHLTQYIGLGPDLVPKLRELSFAKDAVDGLVMVTDGVWRVSESILA